MNKGKNEFEITLTSKLYKIVGITKKSDSFKDFNVGDIVYIKCKLLESDKVISENLSCVNLSKNNKEIPLDFKQTQDFFCCFSVEYCIK